VVNKVALGQFFSSVSILLSTLFPPTAPHQFIAVITITWSWYKKTQNWSVHQVDPVLTHPTNLVFFIMWGGVRLGPLGATANNWPVVPAPDMKHLEE
jgi:hypothetical protein